MSTSSHIDSNEATNTSPSLEKKLEQMLTSFENSYKAEKGDNGENPHKNLRRMLEETPDLKNRILESIGLGNFQKFEILDTEKNIANAGGSYNSNDKTMRLLLSELKEASQNQKGMYQLIHTVGHEIRHAYDRNDDVRSDKEFSQQAKNIANSKGSHNYTEAVKNSLDFGRENEARAEIAGFNAVAAKVRLSDPNAGLKELHQSLPSTMGRYIERTPTLSGDDIYSLAPGLAMNADMTLDFSAQNIAAVGHYYYDDFGILGKNKNQDYASLYGERLLNEINAIEQNVSAKHPGVRMPTAEIDMAATAADKSLVNTALKFKDVDAPEYDGYRAQFIQRKLDEMFVDTNKASVDETQNAGRSLRQLIEKSPYLNEKIADSVWRNNLYGIEASNQTGDSGHHYSAISKKISVPANTLNSGSTDQLAQAETIFSLGRSIELSMQRHSTNSAIDRAHDSARALLEDPTIADITGHAQIFIRERSVIESKAEIAGFNSLASWVKQEKPTAKLEDVYNAYPEKMINFIDRGGTEPHFTCTMKPGFKLERDMMLKDSIENIEATIKHHGSAQERTQRIAEDFFEATHYGLRTATAEAKKNDPTAAEPQVRIDFGDIGLRGVSFSTPLKLINTDSKTHPENRLDLLIDKLAKSTTEPHEKTSAKNLRDLLQAEPYLKSSLVEAVAKGKLEEFSISKTGGFNEIGYSPEDKAITLAADSLSKSIEEKSSRAEAVIAMGRAIGELHSTPSLDQKKENFLASVDQFSQKQDPKHPGRHDYTALGLKFLETMKEREVVSAIGSFNALAQSATQNGREKSLGNLYETHPASMRDFIDRQGTQEPFRYTMKEGLALESDMTLKYSPQNIEAIGKHHFDKPASEAKLGPCMDQDYRNHYGNLFLDGLHEMGKENFNEYKKTHPSAKPPQVILDLDKLGLDKLQINTPLKFIDSSPKTQETPRPHGPNATANGNDHPADPPQRDGAMLIDNPLHPNHRMYTALLGVVNERDSVMGREPDEISRQLACGLVEKARERKLDTIGAAKFTEDGTKVGMTDTPDLYSPLAKTAVGNVAQLAGQTREQSSENVARINHQIALEHGLKPQTYSQTAHKNEEQTTKGQSLS
jgi:hypothetical protein